MCRPADHLHWKPWGKPTVTPDSKPLTCSRPIWSQPLTPYFWVYLEFTQGTESWTQESRQQHCYCSLLFSLSHSAHSYTSSVAFGQNKLSQKIIQFLRLFPGKAGFTNTAHRNNRPEADCEDRELIWLALADNDMMFKSKLPNQKHIYRFSQVKH